MFRFKQLQCIHKLVRSQLIHIEKTQSILKYNQPNKFGVLIDTRLHYVSSNSFFLFKQILKGQKRSVEDEIAELETQISDPSISNKEQLDHITSLINLKQSHFQSKSYLGFASDLLKQSNALFATGQTKQAFQILEQCETLLRNALLTSMSQKSSLQIEREMKSLNLELADCILMRLQMSHSHQFSSSDCSLKSCIEAIEILNSVQESQSEHMAIAHQVKAEIHYNRGEIESTARSLEHAIEILSQILKCAKNDSDSNKQSVNLLVRYAGCLETLGNLHFDLRNLMQTQELLTTALKIWHDKIGTPPEQYQNLYLRCLNSLGTFYTSSGWISKALEILLDAEKQNRSILNTDPEGHAWLLLNIAKAWYSRENYSESLLKSQEAEQIIRGVSRQISSEKTSTKLDWRFRRSLASILEHQSILLTIQGKHSESTSVVEEGIKLFQEEAAEEACFEPIYTRLLFSRAMQYLQSAEFDKAIELAGISLNIVESSRGKNDVQVADALRVKGIALCELAIVQLKREMEGESVAVEHSKSEEKFEQGMKFLERALLIVQDNEGNNHVNVQEVEEQLVSDNFNPRLQDVQAILGDIVSLYEAKKDFKRAIARLENMRCVRTQYLHSNGLNSEFDGILLTTNAKIATLYQHIHPLSPSL